MEGGEVYELCGVVLAPARGRLSGTRELGPSGVSDQTSHEVTQHGILLPLGRKPCLLHPTALSGETPPWALSVKGLGEVGGVAQVP